MLVTEGQTLRNRFRLDQQVGQGGFALVFLATDLILKRLVAIKVLKPEAMHSEDADFLVRFEQEAQAVAALTHPNILPIYDYGQEAATTYLVMPYVDGGSLHDKLRGRRALTADEAYPYLQQVAAALDYAHRRNIVHRDVKPQNMLLRAEDDLLFLADFGIAKVIGEGGGHTTKLVGTLSYMAPEQFQGWVSPATDIYALGCVLFQMLTGHPPFAGSTEKLIYSHLHAPVPSLGERGQGQLGAVQSILERAMAKNPAERFARASDLARAFGSVLGTAAPAQLPAATGGGLAAPVDPAPSGSVGSPADHFASTRDGAPHPAMPAPPMHTTSGHPVSNGKTNGGAVEMPAPAQLDAPPGATVPAPLLAGTGAGTATPDPAARPAAAATARRLAVGRARLLGAALVTVLVIGLAAGVPLALRGRGELPLTSLAGDGIPTATAAPFRGFVAAAPPLEHASGFNMVAWAPDAGLLAGGSHDGSIRLWRADGTPAATLTGHTKAIEGIAWSPNGQLLASCSGDRTVRLWRADGTPVGTPMEEHTNTVERVAWSPDGQLLASAARDALIKLWRTDGTPVRTLTGHTDSVTRVAWSPDGATLASASADHTVRLWRPDGTPVRKLEGHENYVTSLDWTRDGKLLASGSDDNTARIWSAEGAMVATLRGHRGRVWSVAWSPDGRTLATASWDRTVRLWRADGTPISATPEEHTDFLYRLAWSPDGAILASAGKDATVRLWSAGGQPLATLGGHSKEVLGLAWSRDGTLATASWDTTVRLWRPRDAAAGAAPRRDQP